MLNESRRKKKKKKKKKGKNVGTEIGSVRDLELMWMVDNFIFHTTSIVTIHSSTVFIYISTQILCYGIYK